MKIHDDIEQGSLEWLALRAGKVTASGFDRIVTPKFEIRTGETPKTYIAELVAERWSGGPLPGFTAFATEQGTILEGADAIPWLELEYNCTVKRVGFISHATEKIGCSPDGIIDGNIGLEVKCPQAVAHVKALLNAKVPDDYLPQVHFSMHVTGFKQWKFLSYKRHFPALLITVERDEAIQSKIAAALDDFMPKLDAAMERLTEINGGPPRHLMPMRPAHSAQPTEAAPEPFTSAMPS